MFESILFRDFSFSFYTIPLFGDSGLAGGSGVALLAGGVGATAGGGSVGFVSSRAFRTTVIVTFAIFSPLRAER